MKAFLIVALLCGMTAQSHAQDFDRKVDGYNHYNAGRMVDVPDAADRPYLTLVVSDDWQRDGRQAEVGRWFQEHPRLVEIRQKTNFNWYTASNPNYETSLKRAVGTAFPIVCLQYGGAPDRPPLGKVAMKCSSATIPNTPDELADMLWDSLGQMYTAPRFEGQRAFTPVLNDPTVDDRCPPDGCQPTPDDVAPIPDILPNKSTSPVVPITILGGAAAGYALIHRKRPQAKQLAV